MRAPQIIRGISCYAPELARENDGFHEDTLAAFYEVEREHFWFMRRKVVIQALFERFLGDQPQSSVLEIGCGTGHVLQQLQKRFPDFQLKGAEIHLKGIEFSKKNLPDVEFLQMDATRMPFSNEFDAIGAFDVIEHITEDEKVIQGVYQALKPKGYFFVSVPQYQFMWSELDEKVYHKRRYSRKELVRKLETQGFDIQYVTSFMFTLFPFMLASRIARKPFAKKQEELTDYTPDELKISGALNKLFLSLSKLDETLIRKGMNLPFGGSLMAVARKEG